MLIIVVAVVIAILAALTVIALVGVRGSRARDIQVEAPPIPEPSVDDLLAAETPLLEPPLVEVPAPAAGRLLRLRDRLSRSQGLLGRGLFSLLSRDTLDDETWEEIEDTLIQADVGVITARELVERLRDRVRVLGTRSPTELRALIRDELVTALRPELDRSVATAPHPDRPAVVLVVGVNGTGKTTTCGKLARVLVADGRTVLLGAADTFRAAAADQLETWGSRVGAETVRGAEGADPAAVAFDAVRRGAEEGVDTVIVDTAGRLHTKQGLMDELGKVKRVVERQAAVDETLLVLDATTGQNGVSAGAGVHRGRRRDRHRPDQAGRHGEGRHRGRRPARARRPGQARRSRRGPGRPGAVRAGGLRRRAARRSRLRQ